jgi:hypothetical protein
VVTVPGVGADDVPRAAAGFLTEIGGQICERMYMQICVIQVYISAIIYEHKYGLVKVVGLGTCLRMICHVLQQVNIYI